MTIGKVRSPSTSFRRKMICWFIVLADDDPDQFHLHGHVGRPFRPRLGRMIRRVDSRRRELFARIASPGFLFPSMIRPARWTVNARSEVASGQVPAAPQVESGQKGFQGDPLGDELGLLGLRWATTTRPGPGRESLRCPACPGSRRVACRSRRSPCGSGLVRPPCRSALPAAGGSRRRPSTSRRTSAPVGLGGDRQGPSVGQGPDERLARRRVVGERPAARIDRMDLGLRGDFSARP